MLDARRMEVYAEVLDRALKVVRPIQADIVDADKRILAVQEEFGIFFLVIYPVSLHQSVSDYEIFQDIISWHLDEEEEEEESSNSHHIVIPRYPISNSL